MDKLTKKIVIIGSGNVATHLAIALFKAKYNIIQVFSRTLESAKILARQIEADYTNLSENILLNADLYIIASSDDSINEIANFNTLKNKFLVHTAGSVSIDVFKNNTSNYGVFYPLQTFSKNIPVNFSEVPICIEASTPAYNKFLCEIADNLNCKHFLINSEERKKLHLAAVFVNNFTNNLYSIAYNLLEKNNLPFEILHSLIKQTAEKATNNNPNEIQTGPAKRGDNITIKKHLKMLNNEVFYKEIYNIFSEKLISQNNT